MDRLIHFLTYQWQRKAVALLTAFMIWVFVHQSITDETIIPNVPIRVINIPEDKTIMGIQPNGIIGRRIPLTLSGSKNVIDMIEPGDIEILLDASQVQQNDWIVQVSKKNLVSLNPSIDLAHHVSDVEHPEFVLKFSQLTTGMVPVNVSSIGFPPPGYDYLDIWPLLLKHKVVGPQEQVQELVNKGLELEIDLSMISKTELDKIKTTKDNFHDDEVSYFLPSHWKKILLPFKGGVAEEINDPKAQDLHVDFLRKEYLSVPKDIAIRVFYPLKDSAKVNPKFDPLLTEGKIKIKDEIPYLSMPLYMKDVSPLFIDVIKDNLELVIVAAEGEENATLHWSLHVVDPHYLEDIYINRLLTHNTGGAVKSNEPRHTKKRENHLRERFRDFIQKVTLYTAPEKKLQLDARMSKNGISVLTTSI